MKLKSLSFATAATLALVGATNAQTVIDITGSTAGRSAVDAKIKALLAPGYTFQYYGKDSTANKHDACIFHGTYDGQPVIIRTFWSGSAAGIRDVATAPQLNNSYILTSVVGSTSGTYGGTVAANPSAFAPASTETVSEIGFSDVFQSSTEYTSPGLVKDDKVAIIPFKFFANKGSTGITSMTPLGFRNLYGSLGETPLSMFTGDVADAGTMVYATGRNKESGTRITTLAETGSGVFASLNQWGYTTISSGKMNGVSFFANDGGYSSGSDVAKMMAATSPDSQPGIYVGYVGASDWSTAAAGVELKWNGVTYSVAALQNGSYTFWGYLHQSRMNLTGTTLAFYEDLRDEITTAPGSGLEAISLMNVERTADGAPVSPK
ncbi:MAG: hypothetical protein J0M04_16895 [Verrucomicrobia bacterium]|nr:hypothetical protein [Verrucomicrobiota bacterium]